MGGFGGVVSSPIPSSVTHVRQTSLGVSPRDTSHPSDLPEGDPSPLLLASRISPSGEAFRDEGSPRTNERGLVSGVGIDSPLRINISSL